MPVSLLSSVSLSQLSTTKTPVLLLFAFFLFILAGVVVLLSLLRRRRMTMTTVSKRRRRTNNSNEKENAIPIMTKTTKRKQTTNNHHDKEKAIMMRLFTTMTFSSFSYFPLFLQMKNFFPSLRSCCSSITRCLSSNRELQSSLLSRIPTTTTIRNVVLPSSNAAKYIRNTSTKYSNSNGKQRQVSVQFVSRVRFLFIHVPAILLLSSSIINLQQQQQQISSTMMIATAQQSSTMSCPLSIYVFDTEVNCANAVAQGSFVERATTLVPPGSAVGQLFADDTCRNTVIMNFNNNDNGTSSTLLLPGRYVAQCIANEQQVAIQQSGCLQSQCLTSSGANSSSDNSKRCQQDATAISSFYSRYTAPLYPVQSVSSASPSCMVLKGSNTNKEVTFFILGDCTDTSCLATAADRSSFGVVQVPSNSTTATDAPTPVPLVPEYDDIVPIESQSENTSSFLSSDPPTGFPDFSTDGPTTVPSNINTNDFDDLDDDIGQDLLPTTAPSESIIGADDQYVAGDDVEYDGQQQQPNSPAPTTTTTTTTTDENDSETSSNTAVASETSASSEVPPPKKKVPLVAILGGVFGGLVAFLMILAVGYHMGSRSAGAAHRKQQEQLQLQQHQNEQGQKDVAYNNSSSNNHNDSNNNNNNNAYDENNKNKSSPRNGNSNNGHNGNCFYDATTNNMMLKEGPTESASGPTSPNQDDYDMDDIEDGGGGGLSSFIHYDKYNNKEQHEDIDFEVSTIGTPIGLAFVDETTQASASIMNDQEYVGGGNQAASGQAPITSVVSNEDDLFTTREKVFELVVPPGKLGMVIDDPNGYPQVSNIKPDSVMKGQVFPGDRLLAVDDMDVSNLTCLETSNIIHRKCNQRRRLCFSRGTLAVVESDAPSAGGDGPTGGGGGAKNGKGKSKDR